MNGDKKEKARERLTELLALQQDVESKFGEEGYNVFIFGSYITTKYDAQNSDIDIAIYAEDFELYKRLSLYLEEYFRAKSIASDIFFIDTTEERKPVNVIQVQESLDFLKQCAQRIQQKSEMYLRSEDAEIQVDCMDIVSAKINDFTQAFKDIIIFLQRQEGNFNGNTSLRYCIAGYDTFGFVQSEEEKLFLRELLLRNEIIHDYFNREIHLQKLIWMMVNCKEGALAVYKNLFHYCSEKKLLEKYFARTVK